MYLHLLIRENISHAIIFCVHGGNLDVSPGLKFSSGMTPSSKNDIFKRATQQRPWLLGILKVEIDIFRQE